MDKIGQTAMAVINQNGASRALQSRPPAVPPALLNRAADYDIPARVWSNWKPASGARELVRAMTEAERGIVERRKTELESGLWPFAEVENGRVEIALSAMFSGFRSMRQTEDDAMAIVEVTRAVLREFPAWAIEKACLKIARKDAGLDPTWPPNDAQIHGVVEAIVKPFQEALHTAKGILSAQIEPPPPRPPARTYEEIKAELAEHGMHIGEKIPPRINADAFLKKYDVPRETYDSLPDLPKDFEYWAGKRKDGGNQ